MADVTLDNLEKEADELVRQHDNLAKMVDQHRKDGFKLMYARLPDTDVERLIQILNKTDFKGYFRDQIH